MHRKLAGVPCIAKIFASAAAALGNRQHEPGSGSRPFMKPPEGRDRFVQIKSPFAQLISRNARQAPRAPQRLQTS